MEAHARQNVESADFRTREPRRLLTHHSAAMQPILALQRTAGNAAVAALLSTSTDLKSTQKGSEGNGNYELQRFGDPFSVNTPVPQVDSNLWLVNDPDARHRTSPPELAWTGARFGLGWPVIIDQQYSNNGKWYYLVTQQNPEGMPGPAMQGWTLATNMEGVNPPETPPAPLWNKSKINTPHVPSAPTQGPSKPSPITELDPVKGSSRYDSCISFLETLDNKFAKDVKTYLESISKRSAWLLSKEGNPDVNEETGKGRDDLVHEVHDLRKLLRDVQSAGLDEKSTEKLPILVNLAINELTPYYAQSTNMDLLEGEKQATNLGTKTDAKTRTCNITSVAMALEALGKTSQNYAEPERVKAIAAHWGKTIDVAELKVAGKSGLDSLRLPDYLQLAAISEVLGDTTINSKSIHAATVEAWNEILKHDFLAKLAQSFGVSAERGAFDLDPSTPKTDNVDDLNEAVPSGPSKKGKIRTHRDVVEPLARARNKMEEASGNEVIYNKRKKEYLALLEKLRKGGKLDRAITKVPLNAYREAVRSQLGRRVEKGEQVVVNVFGHFVRLQGIHDDYVVVDDPGNKDLANFKVNYEEARAMAYFRRWIILR